MIYFYASVHDISSYIEKKYGLFVQMFCIKFQLLKMLSIFLAIKVAYQNSISNYGIIRRAARKLWWLSMKSYIKNIVKIL